MLYRTLLCNDVGVLAVGTSPDHDVEIAAEQTDSFLISKWNIFWRIDGLKFKSGVL
jgi:hypothetical protein